MDKRKFNKGTKGNKGGRPPKADEVKLIESLDRIAAPQQVWEQLFQKVNEGDFNSIKLWLAYRYGVPRNQEVANAPNEQPLFLDEDLSLLTDEELEERLHQARRVTLSELNLTPIDFVRTR